MQVYEGTILTVDEHDTVASYLVEDQGRILYVGDELPQEYASAPCIHLGSSVVCPAFVDTHEHLASFATFQAGLNVMDARSNKEIQHLIKKFAATSHAKTLIAFGASPYSVEEGRLLSRQELDEACPDKPIMMVKYDGHACIVNSALLKLVDDKVKHLRGYHPQSGEMNQEAFFAVSDFITASISLPDLISNIQKAMDYLASKGIGMVHSVSGVGFAGDLDITLEVWLAKSAQEGFSIRVFPQSMDVQVAQKRGLPRIGGCFECALDGCFGSQDAALLEPYCNDPANSGVLYYTDEQVLAFCRAAHNAGLQIEMHAIGDAAFNQAARCLAQVIDENPRPDHRHGIIHACLPTPQGLELCASHHIHFPMQTSFINWRQEPDSYLREILGDSRAEKLNPLRSYWDAGITLSAGSDAPCTDPDPILWMERACNHDIPEQSLTPQEALRMCTYNGAWTTFDEKERGSLEAGKVCDMAILSGNPYTCGCEHLGELKVENLILSGKPYDRQHQGIAAAVVKGVFSKNQA